MQQQSRFLLIFISLLLLTTLACQAAANPQRLLPAANPNMEEVVAQAVATIEARPQTAPESPLTNTRFSGISPELEQTLIDLYERTNPSVVHIFVFDNQGEYLGTGTGFVFDDKGHIVTNNHVIAGAEEMEVVFPDGQRRYANIVGTDTDSDLAVLQIDNPPANAPALPLGDSGGLRVGQFVVAIGNPFGEASSMSVGIISGLGRTIESQRVIAGGSFSIPQVIQTDAAINPGNSGGPLLNLQGEVVGINSAILTRTGANSGVGFSIPVNAVQKIAPALVAVGQYEYPYIGISMMPDSFTLRQLEALGLPPNGVFITAVGPNTPAAAAGLIGHDLTAQFTADGDYITAIDGNPVRDSDDLLSYLVFETEVGQTVDLTIIRGGKEIVVPLTLGERP